MCRHGSATGCDASAFEVVPKQTKRPKAGGKAGGNAGGKAKASRTGAAVAAQASDELDDLNATSIFINCGGVPLYSEQVLQPALERARAKVERHQERVEQKDVNLQKLQREVKAILDESTSVEHIATTALVVVTRYVFSALKLKNVTRATKSRTVASLKLTPA